MIPRDPLEILKILLVCLTWERIRGVMERLHLIEFFSKDGRVLQTTEPTKEQLNIFKLLKISPPKRMQDIQINP